MNFKNFLVYPKSTPHAGIFLHLFMAKYFSPLPVITIRLSLFIIWILFTPTCPQKRFREPEIEQLPVKNIVVFDDSLVTVDNPPPAALVVPYGSKHINTGTTTPEELLAFAKTLIGIPYKYGSADPAVGFDCSGFITYVFNHFKIVVPRSSIDFTNFEREISLSIAKPGDIVLFTGTDSTSREVGHMGIITSNENGEYYFIHSTSGKANGVTITLLNKYYTFRFVKVIRIFPQNDLDF